MKVAIADDHPASILGIQHGLLEAGFIEIVGLATNSSELVPLLDATSCDAVVVDYSMPTGAYGDGITLMNFLRRRYPGLKIVVFTMMENVGVLRMMFSLGFQQIVSKGDCLKHLRQALHAAKVDKAYLSPMFSHVFDPAIPDSLKRSEPDLSSRELEVVRLYVSGMTVGQIAKQLNRSNKTISAQKMAAMRKIGIAHESDLITYAIGTGLTKGYSSF